MSVQKSNGPIIDPALCRCCRAIKKCRVLTAEYNWMGKKEVYADMVMDCYGILLSHVDDNEKDSGVCATCVVRLREATAFRHQVLQCEELFLQAKLDPPEEEKDINYENKLKKMELELKTEPKDYNSDHNSVDDRDDPCANYSDDDADDNKPLVSEVKKPEMPLPLKDEEVKTEESEDYNDGSSSDSDEPIKKKAKRKTKANGAKKKPGKGTKKQKADTDTETEELTEGPIKMEFSEGESFDSLEYLKRQEEYEAPEISEVPVEVDIPNEFPKGSADIPESKGKKRWIRYKGNNVSEYEKVQQELESNEDFHFRYLNMSKSSFEELHEMVEEMIAKVDTQMRKSISTKERLMLCLRYYRTGQSYKNLADKFLIGVTTASKIVKEVSKVLWGVLQPIYMPAPDEHTWRQAAIGFQEIWDFPNCVGSFGGKHIIARHYPDLDPEYPKVSDAFRHRRMVTIALLAVTDPFNRIIALDIGNYAMEGDSGILENSKFYKKYMVKDFRPPKPLPGDTQPARHVLITDRSFGSKLNLLRPFPPAPNSGKSSDQSKRKFNKFLDRACTVTKTFDILMKSWAALDRPMECQIEAAVGILKAICCLHNFVLKKHGTSLPSVERARKPSRGIRRSLKCLKPFKPINQRPTNDAIAVREKFVAYFDRIDLGDDDPLQSHGVSETLDPVSISAPVGNFEKSCDGPVSSDDQKELVDPNQAFESGSGLIRSTEYINKSCDHPASRDATKSVDPIMDNSVIESVTKSVGDSNRSCDDPLSDAPKESVDLMVTDQVLESGGSAT